MFDWCVRNNFWITQKNAKVLIILEYVLCIIVLFVNTSNRDSRNYIFAILEEEGLQGYGRADLPKTNITQDLANAWKPQSENSNPKASITRQHTLRQIIHNIIICSIRSFVFIRKQNLIHYQTSFVCRFHNVFCMLWMFRLLKRQFVW